MPAPTEPKLAPVNLNDLVEELGLLVRHKLANQGIKFIRDLYPTLPLVLGDAPQLEQAFLNLILNAAESMQKGGALTIRSKVLKNRDNSQHVVIKFKDTGEGMTEEQRKRAFRAVFATTKVKGSGLGLAIVGRIIETHQGQITILSRVGRGTTIQVKMPVITEH